MAAQAWHTTALQAAIKTTEAWEPTRRRAWEASRLAYQARSPAPPGEPMRAHKYEWHQRLRRYICTKCLRTRTQGGPHCPAVPTKLMTIAYKAAKMGHHLVMSTPVSFRHDTPSIVACTICTRYSQRRAQGLATRCQGPGAAKKHIQKQYGGKATPLQRGAYGALGTILRRLCRAEQMQTYM